MILDKVVLILEVVRIYYNLVVKIVIYLVKK